MSVDFEHTWLPKAMARFAVSHPKIVVELRVDRNSALEQAVTRRDIDIALVLGNAVPVDAALVGTVPMVWIAARDFAWEAPASLPLLLLEPPCMFRTAGLQALDAAATPWRVAVTSPSLGGLWATALAGMGVTVRSAVVLPRGPERRRVAPGSAAAVEGGSAHPRIRHQGDPAPGDAAPRPARTRRRVRRAQR
jgi:DNA-binding transcriptional LysR family regulator